MRYLSLQNFPSLTNTMKYGLGSVMSAACLYPLKSAIEDTVGCWKLCESKKKSYPSLQGKVDQLGLVQVFKNYVILEYAGALLRISGIFNQNIAKYFSLIFTDQLIASTKNRPPSVFANSDRVDLKTLEEKYGKDEIACIRKLAPHQETFSKCKQMGCCWGMSLYWTGAYLDKRQSKISPLEAVKLIANDFAFQIPQKAEILQILDEAVHDREAPELEPLQTAFRNELHSLGEYIDKKCSTAAERAQNSKKTTEECKAEAEEIRAEYRKKVTEIQNKFEPQLQEISDRYGLLKNEELSKMLGLTLKETLAKSPLSERNGLNCLPNGIHVVSLSGQDSGHAIVFIKQDEGLDIIFDPNTGVFVEDPTQSADRIRMIAEKLYGSDAFVTVQSAISTHVNPLTPPA